MEITAHLIDPENSYLIERTWSDGEQGFIITHFGTYTDSNEIRIQRKVFSTDAENIPHGEEDWKAIEELLWSLLDIMEIFFSKHHKKRLEIRVVDNE